MAVMDAKFSTFDNGGDLIPGDIVVGLRGGLNTKFNNTGGVGTFLPLLGGTMLGAINMGGFGISNISNLELSGTISQPTFIQSSTGLPVLAFGYAGGATDYLGIGNGTANGAILRVLSGNPNASFSILSKGSGGIFIGSETVTTAPIVLESNGNTFTFSIPTWTGNHTLTFPDADVTFAAGTGIVTIDGDSGSISSGTGIVTISGGSTGLTTTGVTATLSLGGLLNSTYGGTGVSAPTAHGIMVAEGASAMTPIVLSSGQILIGSTGVDPVAAAINSGTGILVGNGAGSITVSLAAIASHDILSNITGGSAAPIANTLTATIDAAIGSTQGNILYRNSTVWTVLAPGTSGFPLISQGAAANPAYGTAVVGGGGTGNTTFTAYSVICAGTTATGAFQNVTGVGTLNQVLVSQGAGALPQWGAVPGLTPAALTKTDDTNVTLTLGGTPSTALLQATSLTLGWTGTLSGSRGGTGVNNGASTITIGGNVTFSGAFTFAGTLTNNTAVTFPTSGTLATTSQLPTPAALTKTDDTNVTLTLGGTPSTALLQATSLTLGWTGTLSVSRGGTGAATLTAHNVLLGEGTSTFGFAAPGATSGVPLISQGASADPVFGTAVVAGGGTGNTTFTAYSVICAGTTATGVFQNVSGVGASGQVLTSQGAAALPIWANATGTGTVNSGTINDLAYYASSTNAVTALATANNGVLVTSAGGVPSISSTLPSGLTIPAPVINHIVGTNGFNVLALADVASTTDYFTMTSGTANSAILQVTSSNTDASFSFFAKGAGGIVIGSTSVTCTTPIALSAHGFTWGFSMAPTANRTLTFPDASVTLPANPMITKIKVTQITAAGAGTYTPTTGMQYVIVLAQAGGSGGGGSAATTTGQASAGGGGSGGEYIEALFTAANIGASKAYSVGAGGAGGAAGANVGVQGGSTTFNTTWIVTNAGNGGSAIAATSATGAFGNPIPGGTGGSVATGTLEKQCAGGNASQAFSCAGGQPIATAGGSAGCGAGGGNASTGNAAGSNAAANSGAGGGGGSTSGTAGSARAGGNGGTGFITFVEYLSV